MRSPTGFRARTCRPSGRSEQALRENKKTRRAAKGPGGRESVPTVCCEKERYAARRAAASA
ncbi:MAG: hypothetical protein BRD52_04815 [Bacteroidetes bacterium SW_4_67_19]|nr:MAG: hypothetical protein BRD52_04815 [Bacteroidetes bacterium SW_4_67_19]